MKDKKQSSRHVSGKESDVKASARSDVVVPEVVDGGTYSELVNAIGELFNKARFNVARYVNDTQVLSYWQTGRYIVEYEQNGRDRAKYGDQLLSRLTHDLTIRYGRGYGKSNLIYMRKLYRAFPKGMTASYQLTWSHYLEILKSNDQLEIEFYCAECSHSHWNVRELRRQIRSSLFERLALSRSSFAANWRGRSKRKPVVRIRRVYPLARPRRARRQSDAGGFPLLGKTEI